MRTVLHLLIWSAIPCLIAGFAHFCLGYPQLLDWVDTAIVIYVLFFSVVIHEISHGLAAFYCGDDTAEKAGRLSLNPVNHISILGTVIVPLALYFLNPQMVLGWARPVPLNPMKLGQYPRDQILTVMAGPLSNFALSFLSFSLFVIMSMIYNFLNPESLAGESPLIIMESPVMAGSIGLGWQILFKVLNHGMLINLVLGVFNLIPFPPLDGSWILRALLPKKASYYVTKFSLFGFILIIFAANAGLFKYFLYPITNLYGMYVLLLNLVFM